MGIFKNLINKVLDAEVPPVIEQLVKKDHIEKQVIAKKSELSDTVLEETIDDDIYSHTEAGNKKRLIVEHQETIENTIKDIELSGFFKPEKIPALAEKIKAAEHIGFPYHDPFDYNECLSLDEKKAIGLNSRQKYSREMVEMLTDEGLKQNDPKVLVKNIYLHNSFKVIRKYKLIELKKMGLKTVEILDCDDERDCSKIKKLKKVWPIDQVPDLPLPGCTAEYCRCGYVAHDVTEI